MYHIVNRLYIILFIVYILCNITGKRVSETLEHSQFSCTGNKETPVLLIKVLKSYDLEVTPSKVLTLDVNLESHMKIPLVGMIATTLSTIWTQRQKGSVCAAKTRAQLKPDVECLGREIAPPCKMLPIWQTSPPPLTESPLSFSGNFFLKGLKMMFIALNKVKNGPKRPCNWPKRAKNA